MGLEEDSITFHRRRKRRRRDDSRTLAEAGGLDMSLPIPLPNNNRRFQFLIFSCLMNNMICILLLITLSFPFLFVSAQEPPHPSPAGFLDFDNLPVTRFTCDGKVIGGYYADVETGCQMFHVCTLGQKDEIQDIKFLCVNGTVFDQETRVCERVDEVDCSQAEKFYDLNLDLYVPYVTTPKASEEVTTTVPTTTSTTTTTTTTIRTTATPMIFSQFRPIHSYLSSQRFQHPQHSTPKPTSPAKGFSSFSYYQRNPQSHFQPKTSPESSALTSSEFNSNFRQSYVINHNQNDEESEETSNPTGRKVPPGGAKHIFYNTHQPFRRNLTRPLPTFATTTTSSTTTLPPTTEEPEYYDEDYSESTAEQESSAPYNYHLEHRQSKKLKEEVAAPAKVGEVGTVGSNNSTAGKGSFEKEPESAYYDEEYGEEMPAEPEYSDEDHAIINPNEHHFTHVDVPRIPYAKPNVPRVLVTNGKPFLPRLRRQSYHHHLHQLIPSIYKTSYPSQPSSSSATQIFLY